MSNSNGWLELGAYIASRQKNNKFVKKGQDKGKGLSASRAANFGKVSIWGNQWKVSVVKVCYVGPEVLCLS